MPTWTKDQLRDYENRRVSCRAKPEPAICHEPVAKKAREDSNPKSTCVGITSFRRRLLDPDNCIPKYFIDGCVYAGILHGDSPDKITLEIRQVKVKTKAEERTEIEITNP